MADAVRVLRFLRPSLCEHQARANSGLVARTEQCAVVGGSRARFLSESDLRLNPHGWNCMS